MSEIGERKIGEEEKERRGEMNQLRVISYQSNQVIGICPFR